MKKFFEFGSEIFLFLFLLLIFTVPILVSFNLDPQVYNENKESNVAGVNSNSNKATFFLNDSFSSERVRIEKIYASETAQELEINIPRGSMLNENIELASFSNVIQARLSASVIKTESNEDIKLSLSVDGIEKDLENEEIEFEIKPAGNHFLALKINSSGTINYERNLKIKLILFE